MYLISVEEKFTFVPEAKRSSLGQAVKPDMRDNNDGGEV